MEHTTTPKWSFGLSLEDAATVRANIMLVGAKATPQMREEEYQAALRLEQQVRDRAAKKGA